MAKVYPNINLCFLYGKIISEIDLQFFYNSKAHCSIVAFQLVIDFELCSKNTKLQILNIRAYDELADILYRKHKKGDFIKLIGELTPKYIEVKEIV